MFTEGDMAVYPAHGVGVIRSIETQKVAGIDQTFYVLEIIGNSMRIMIPTSIHCRVPALFTAWIKTPVV